MELQLPSLALGALVAVATAVAGRFLWRAIENSLNGSAKLIWFISYASKTEFPKDTDDALWNLYGDAKKQDASWDENDKFKNLYRNLRKTLDTTAIVVHNIGTASAEGVTILLSEDPQKIIVYPDLSIHKKNTADGRFELLLDAVKPSGQFKITLIGVQRFDIKKVTHRGAESREFSHPEMLPIQYLEEKSNLAQNRMWNIIAAIFVISALSSATWQLLMGSVQPETAKSAAQEQQVEEK